MRDLIHQWILWGLLGWLGVGALLILLWIGVFVGDYLRDRAARKAIRSGKFGCYIPFTAGHLNFPDGTFRSDAFGVKMPPNQDLPKAGERILVNTGLKFEPFTVAMCETLTMLGVGDPEKGKKFERAPEVYILVKERLPDATIIKIKETFGTTLGFDPAREPQGKQVEALRKPTRR